MGGVDEAVPRGVQDVAATRRAGARLRVENPPAPPTGAAARGEPHRVLFTVGALLGALGVVPWLLFAVGLPDAYRPIFHALAYRAIFHPIAEVQGFLSCCAAGFVLTAVPRRTGTPPAPGWLVALAAAAPVVTTACAWSERWAAAQIAWLVLLAVLLAFALSRRARGSAVPGRAVWLPLGLAMGAAGAAAGALGGSMGRGGASLTDLGRGLLLQGLLTALVLGSADELLATVGRAAPPRAPGARRAAEIAAHLALGAAYVASFGVGSAAGPRIGFALRAATVLAALVGPLRGAGRTPARGWRSALAGAALWMLPLGDALVALAPRYRRAGLHVVYLGCFTALALTLAASLAPRPASPERAAVRRSQLAWAGALLGVALLARVLLEVDAGSFHLWLGTSSGAFVGALVLGAVAAGVSGGGETPPPPPA